MSNPTEIIIYRSPLEKLVWDSLLDDPVTFFMLVALGGASILAATYLGGWWKRNREQSYCRFGKKVKFSRQFFIGIAWLVVACFLFFKLFFI